MPQPPSSSIEVDFSPGRPALSPVTVGVVLSQGSLEINFTGADFAHAGWWVDAAVPLGVDMNGALENYPSYTADGTDFVHIARVHNQAGDMEH